MAFKKKKNRMTQAGEIAMPADKLTAILEWPGNHRWIMAVLAVLLGAAFMLFILPVQEASANPAVSAGLQILKKVASVIGLGAIGSAAGGAVGGEVADFVKELLANGCNAALGSIMYNTLNFTGSAMGADGQMMGIFSNFDALVGPDTRLYEDCIKVIHGVLINSIGMAVMCVCLVVGLGKVLTHAGQTEAGVNLWQLFMPFIMFIAGSLLISNSLVLMQLPYDIMKQFTDAVGTKIALGDGFNQTAPADSSFITADNIDNFSTGTLFFTLFILFFVWLGSFIVAGFANTILLFRGMQIYAYTAIAPIAIGFVVADSTRNMATGFAKRYLAVVLSFFIMYLILIMASYALVGIVNFIAAGSNWGSGDELLGLQGNCLTLLATCAACGFALYKSGAWAKEVVGIG